MSAVHMFCYLQEFSQLYLINAEDVLGSGQFGIVYGGLRFFYLFQMTCNETAVKP
jgi:hypothetical protein